MTLRVTRRTVVVLALVLAAIVAACWFVLTSGPSDTRPVTLPPAFMGLNTSTLNDESTAAALADAVDGAPLAVTTYGDVGGTILNVVATRTDMTDLVDLRFRGDEGRLIGQTRCTSNVVLREPDQGVDTPGSPMTGKLLCWRTSENLSVSAFVLSRPPAQEDVAAAIDAFWPTLG